MTGSDFFSGVWAAPLFASLASLACLLCLYVACLGICLPVCHSLCLSLSVCL